jgi:hypothetical protein
MYAVFAGNKMTYTESFKKSCTWEFTWSILITLLVIFIATGKIELSILTTLVLAGIKAIGLTIFLKR